MTKLITRAKEILLCALIGASAYSQPGTLDSTFGVGGKTTTELYLSQECYDMAVQSDGKIVAVGRSKNGTDFNFCIFRYNEDGTLDTAFGINGGLYVDMKDQQNFDQANTVLIQPDGKILVGGSAGLETNNSYSHFALLRLNTNGSLDTGFGISGKISFAIGSTFLTPYNSIQKIMLQSDGKIVAVGQGNNSSTARDFAIARLNADGSLDVDFSNDGKATFDFADNTEYGMNFNLESDGKILLAGNTSENLGLIKLLPDGSVDTTYGTDGRLILPTGNTDFLLNGVNFQTDGKIVVSGRNTGDIVLQRFSADGSIDTTFGVNGITTTDVDNESGDSPSKTVIIQPDGKIIIIGSVATGSTNYFAALRYTSQGVLDSTFSNDGKILTNFGAAFAYGMCGTLQQDGKLLVGGYYGYSGVTAFALARYNTGLVLGVQDYSKQDEVKISPNPAIRMIELHGLSDSQRFKYEIFDSNGRIAGKGALEKTVKHEIDITRLSSGIYFIKVDNMDSIKFIKY